MSWFNWCALIAVQSYFSCFTDTALASWLKERNCTDIFVGGVTLTTCVRASLCDAKLLGFNARLLRDCSLARNDNQQAADTLNHIARHYVSGVLNSYELARTMPAVLPFVHDTRLLTGVLDGDETDIYNRLLREVRFAQMHSRGAPVPRLVAMQVLPDAEGNLPLYRHPADEHPRSEVFTPLVLFLRGVVKARVGLEANHALIQHYRDRCDSA